VPPAPPAPAEFRELLVQVTSLLDTAPSEVAGLNVQVTVYTTVPGGCSTVIVALVNATSVIVSVQFGFGQPGAPAIGDTGPSVVTLNVVLPFLISLAGMDWLPVRVTSAGFCPGASLPPWFVQVAVTDPVAVKVTSTSPFPNPASSPAAVRVRPLSVKAG
jgi:hypothetical protein